MTLARLSATILTAALAALAFSTRPIVAEPSCKSYLFGLCTSRYTPAEQAKIDQLPTVPNPSGFIEASTLAAFIRNLGVAGQPASFKLIGVYYQPDALAEILSAGRAITAAFCKAHVEKEFESVEAADNFLKRFAASTISAYTVSDGQQRAISSFVIAIAWMRIGKRVRTFSASYPFLGKASILAANDTLLNWLKSVEASN